MVGKLLYYVPTLNFLGRAFSWRAFGTLVITLANIAVGVYSLFNFSLLSDHFLPLYLLIISAVLLLQSQRLTSSLFSNFKIIPTIPISIAFLFIFRAFEIRRIYSLESKH